MFSIENKTLHSNNICKSKHYNQFYFNRPLDHYIRSTGNPTFNYLHQLHRIDTTSNITVTRHKVTFGETTTKKHIRQTNNLAKSQQF